MSEIYFSDDGISPRICNTGAQNTEKNGLILLVDWVSFTLKIGKSFSEVFELLGIPGEEFLEMDHGLHGYKRMKTCGHIKLLYDGREDMGIHIEMSGQGCREYETYYNPDWVSFFERMIKAGASFTRIDLACDDMRGYFTVEQLIKKIKKGECRSKFKKSRLIETVKIDSGESQGNTIYFGQPTSRIKVRIYEKNYQLQAQGIEVDKLIWNRVEIEARKERAEILAYILSRGEDIGKVFTGILNNYVTFVNYSKDKNKSRWPVSKFWVKFIGDTEKLKLTTKKPERTIERMESWVDKQVVKSLAMLFYAHDSEMEWLIEKLNNGFSRMDHKDKTIILDYVKRKNASSKEQETF